jgi:hypothetical protein
MVIMPKAAYVTWNAQGLEDNQLGWALEVVRDVKNTAVLPTNSDRSSGR